MTETETLKKVLKTKPATNGTDVLKSALSTGLTLLNLGMAGRPNVGLTRGNYYLLVGESSSGKSFLAMQCLAEAANNPQYDKYSLDYYDIEGGALASIGGGVRRFFGQKLSKRLNTPNAQTVEHFFDQTIAKMEEGPCIIVLDSTDALDDEATRKLRKVKAAARESNKDGPGSYGASKAKELKSGLRALMGKKGPLAKHGSILLIISQTIDKLDFGFEKTTRAGGKALKFFAKGEVWFKVAGPLKKSVRGKQRKIGSKLQLDIKKNRETGREPSIAIPFYPSVGFDEIGSMIDFLTEEGHWKGGGKKEEKDIVAKEFSFKGSREELVKHIEENRKTKELRNLVGELWESIEDACNVTRARRYE